MGRGFVSCRVGWVLFAKPSLRIILLAVRLVQLVSGLGAIAPVCPSTLETPRHMDRTGLAVINWWFVTVQNKRCESGNQPYGSLRHPPAAAAAAAAALILAAALVDPGGWGQGSSVRVCVCVDEGGG